MITLKFIDNVDRDTYEKFTQGHDKSHFLESYAWGEFCRRIKGQIPHYVGMTDDDGNLVATALILERKTPLGYGYGYSPRGFIIDYKNKELIKEFTEYLRDYMKRMKLIYIKFDPDIPYQDIDEDANPIPGGNNNYELYNYMLSLGYIHTGFYKLYDGNQPRYTFRINLKRSWEEIEECMSKSFLKSVKRSYGYNLVVDNEERTEEFFRLIQSNSAKDDFDAHDLKYYQVFTEELKKENGVKYFNISIRPKELVENITSEIKKVKEELGKATKRKEDLNNQLTRLEKDLNTFKDIDKDEVVVCSLICTYTKNRAWSMFIGSDDLANITFAVTRSYYEAIKDAYDNGYEFFDLFGTPGDPHTTYKNLAKLHDFKRKFGDKYTEFIGEFDLVNKKFLYKILPVLLKVYRKLRR